MNAHHRASVAILYVLLASLSVHAGVGRLAILGALDDELIIINKHMTLCDTVEVMGLPFLIGSLGGTDVIAVKTGVGKVNATMTTTLLLDHFHPHAVIFTGVAGAINPDILPGDIVIGHKVGHHDMMSVSEEGIFNFAVRNPRTGKRNPVLFRADHGLQLVARQAASSVSFSPIIASDGERSPSVHEGIIVSGDSFVASDSMKAQLRIRMKADAVEMEGAAVAQICHQYRIPCIVIRSISDSADRYAATDFERFLGIAAENSAALVLEMIQLLKDQDGE